MKKCINWLLVVVFYCTCVPVNGENIAWYNKPHPSRQPGGCYLEEVGHMQQGMALQLPGYCVQAICHPSGATMFKNCEMTSQRDVKYCGAPDFKPYPECCMTPCPENQNTPQNIPSFNRENNMETFYQFLQHSGKVESKSVSYVVKTTS